MRSTSRAFGALYDVRTTDEGSVEVGHSAAVYVIDDDGLFRLQWPFGTKSEDMTRDLERFLEQEISHD